MLVSRLGKVYVPRLGLLLNTGVFFSEKLYQGVDKVTVLFSPINKVYRTIIERKKSMVAFGQWSYYRKQE